MKSQAFIGKLRGFAVLFLTLSLVTTAGVNSVQAATNVTISGLATKYGPGEKVSYEIFGTPGDACQLSYQNQAAKPFTMGSAGSVNASFTTGPSASLIVIDVTCSQSGTARAQSEIVIPASTPTPTPEVASPTVALKEIKSISCRLPNSRIARKYSGVNVRCPSGTVLVERFPSTFIPVDSPTPTATQTPSATQTPIPTPSVTPTPVATLPGVDASVNSTLSSIIEPLANTCEEGDISTVRADGLGFGQGDNVKVNIYNANNVELNLSLVAKSSMAGEKSIDTRVQICQTDPAYMGSSQEYKLVMTYSDALGYFIQSQEYKFRLISRLEVAKFSEYASSQVRSKCVFDNYAANNTYVQSGTTRKSGEKMTIKGTFYRAGLVAPSDTLKLLRVVNSTNSKVIATTTTDKDGKYSFTFEALTFPKALLYRIEAPERTSDLGPVPGPFPSKIWTVFIDCKKGCKIEETSMRDEAPINNFSEVCLQSLSFYDQVTRQNDDENSRILRKVVIYPILSTIIRSRTETTAKSAATNSAAATAGNKNLPNKPVTPPRTISGNSGSSGTSAGKSKSSSSGGGSVRVKGYTRKDGTRVKAHTRSR